jgi:hypothetical protein
MRTRAWTSEKTDNQLYLEGGRSNAHFSCDRATDEVRISAEEAKRSQLSGSRGGGRGRGRGRKGGGEGKQIGRVTFVTL